MQTHTGGGVQGLQIEKQMSRYRNRDTETNFKNVPNSPLGVVE